MLRILKWEFRKRLNDMFVLLFICLVFAFLSLLIPTDKGIYSELFATICSAYVGIILSIYSLYCIVSIAYELRKPYALLEKLVDKKPQSIIGGKLINNLLWTGILYAMAKLVEIILRRFSTPTRSYLSIGYGFEYIVIIGFFLPLLILFYYLLANRFTITKKFPIFTTASLVVISSIIMSDFLRSFSFVFHIRSNEVMEAIVVIMLSILLFFGSCKLYEKNLEL